MKIKIPGSYGPAPFEKGPLGISRSAPNHWRPFSSLCCTI